MDLKKLLGEGEKIDLMKSKAETLAERAIGNFIKKSLACEIDLKNLLAFCEENLQKLTPKLHDIWFEQTMLFQNTGEVKISDSIKQAVLNNLMFQQEWSNKIRLLRKLIKRNQTTEIEELKTRIQNLEQDLRSKILKLEYRNTNSSKGDYGSQVINHFIELQSKILETKSRSELTVLNHGTAITENVNAIGALKNRIDQIEEGIEVRNKLLESHAKGIDRVVEEIENLKNK